MLKKATSKSYDAYINLKERILEGGYNYGEVMSATNIAAELQMSRTPVIEAFKILELEGLVEVVPQVGIIIKPLNEKDIEEKFSARALMESYMAAEAAKKCTPHMEAKLSKMIKNMDDSIQAGDIEEYLQLNNEFHRAISDIADNKYICRLIQELRNYQQYTQLKQSIFNEKSIIRSFEEHKEILDAIVAKDPDRASAVMNRHITRVKENKKSRLKKD